MVEQGSGNEDKTTQKQPIQGHMWLVKKVTQPIQSDTVIFFLSKGIYPSEMWSSLDKLMN